jgi:hypothetical protein
MGAAWIMHFLRRFDISSVECRTLMPVHTPMTAIPSMYGSPEVHQSWCPMSWIHLSWLWRIVSTSTATATSDVHDAIYVVKVQLWSRTFLHLPG